MKILAQVAAPGRIIITFVALLICAVAASAYSFMPLVTCYSEQENSCATQAWDAAQDSDGVFYFGTSDGLLTFDGVRWESFDLPGIQIVRSVLAVGNYIYIGAYEQFGYIERDGCGLPVYHSLTDGVEGLGFRDDEFWNIVAFGNNIYFQSFRGIYCYDGKSVRALCDTDRAPLYLFGYKDALYSQLISGGLAAVDFSGVGKPSFRPFVGRHALGNADVVAMLDCGGYAMLCTETAGLFTLAAGESVPRRFSTEVDRQLRDYSVNRAIRMRDGTVAVGTLRNGVYALNPDGSLRWHYNIDNRLGNNSVLGLAEDASGNLWVMMDHGISVVHSGLPYTFLMPHAGEPNIGMTYAMLRSVDNLYVGTNQGLYTYSFTDRMIRENDNVRSQIWHINTVDNRIFVGGGTVSARILPGNVVVSDVSSSTDIKSGVIHNREVLVESSYYSIRLYTRGSDGRWTYSHDIDGFGAPVRQVEIDSDGTLWCSHLAQGVIHLELSPDLRTVVSKEIIRHSRSDSPHATSFVMKIRGRIAVSDGDSLYRYDAAGHGLVAMADLHRDLPSVKGAYNATPVDDRRFWLSSRKSYTLVSYGDGRYMSELSIPLDFLSLQSNGVNNNVYVDDSLNCYFAINNGVGCVSLGIDGTAAIDSRMNIVAVEHVGSDGVRTRLPLVSGHDNSVSTSGNISFRLSYPAYNFRAPKFRYTLAGPDSIVFEDSEPQADFVGLKHGRYTFTAAMIDDNGYCVTSVQYVFNVPVPAWLSVWAVIGYIIAFAAITFGCSRLYIRRQVNHQRRQHEIERVAQNLKILEQERIISEQQKQLLQQELSLKGKELASMALEANFKHQVIENLRETITAQRRKGLIGSQEVDSLIKTINSDIGSNEFWDIFQSNFDLIHENFFRNLRKRFPELTSTDMKFCALLRLNMSTKDIAKFTQLTVRGVETARYRLRRKFGLESSESIVQFLIDFK